jgi:hypothetical protein
MVMPFWLGSSLRPEHAIFEVMAQTAVSVYLLLRHHEMVVKAAHAGSSAHAFLIVPIESYPPHSMSFPAPQLSSDLVAKVIVDQSIVG